jgi:drug/metabolite transporter (DMT)-like permease
MAGGIILLHQVPTLREACGCLLMLLAVVLLQLPVPARKKQ